MTQSITLIVPATITLTVLEKMLGEVLWRKAPLPPDWAKDRLQLQRSIPHPSGNPTRYYVEFKATTVTETLDFYLSIDEDEISPEIEAALADKVFYYINFNDMAFVKEAVTYLLNQPEMTIPECWIDDDHGALIPARRFLDKLQAEPNWDWRRVKFDL